MKSSHFWLVCNISSKAVGRSHTENIWNADFKHEKSYFDYSCGDIWWVNIFWVQRFRSNLLITEFIYLMKGAWRGSSEVTLNRTLCVLRGASAVINCRYYSPIYHRVRVGWWKGQQMADYWWRVPFLTSGDPSQHYQYLGNFINDCSLQINDVQRADAGNYVFTFQTEYKSSTSKTSQLSVEGNNRSKPASKCLKPPSNSTLFPVIQSWRLLCSRAPLRKATSSRWPVCRAVPRRWTPSGSIMDNV